MYCYILYFFFPSFFRHILIRTRTALGVSNSDLLHYIVCCLCHFSQNTLGGLRNNIYMLLRQSNPPWPGSRSNWCRHRWLHKAPQQYQMNLVRWYSKHCLQHQQLRGRGRAYRPNSSSFGTTREVFHRDYSHQVPWIHRRRLYCYFQ